MHRPINHANAMRWLGGALLCFAIAGAPLVARADAGVQPAQGARVDISAARRIALSARPGTITDQELEQEPGGTGSRYSFDVKSGAVTYEVGVDAATGRVLENTKEGKTPD